MGLSFDMQREADILESSIKAVLAEGIRTADLGGNAKTKDIGAAVLAKVEATLAKV